MSPALLTRNVLVAIGIATAGAAGLGVTEDRVHEDSVRSVPHDCTAIWTPAAPRTPIATPAVRGLAGSATVTLTLDTRGNVTGATILTGSGSAAVDRAALVASRALKFVPEMVDCRPVAGSYVTVVAFER